MRRKAILVLLFLLVAIKIQAAETDLIISEIMYDAVGSDSGHEWIEVFNSGPDTVTVSSTWRFFDSSNHGLNLEQATTTIDSQDFFVLTDNKDNFLLDYPDFSGLVIDTVMSLPNSSSTVALSFDSGTTYPVEATYDSTWGGADGLGLQLVEGNWAEGCAIGGTPGAPNAQCETEEPPEEGDLPEIDYSPIVISELLPNPAGSDDNEWIEIYNSGSESIDLAGLILGDNSTKRFTLNEISLGANSYLVLYKETTGISLNNGGDAVRLYDPNENLLYAVEYFDSAIDDRSYAKNGSEFVWTRQPTPGSANQFVVNQPPIAEIIIEDGEFLLGEKITFSAKNSYDPEGEDLDYKWDFGDGDSSTRETIKHDYDQVGRYVVKLTVTDNEDAETITEMRILIEAKEEAKTEKVEEEPAEEKIIVDLSEDDLLISEFIPNPKGSDDHEWIELYNNSDKEIDLYGWYLDDSDGGSKPYQFSTSTIMTSGGFLVVERTDSKITLNNSTDSVRILNPNQEVWQEVAYEKIPEAKSYAWDMENSEWFESDPSPGAANLKIIEPEIVYAVSEIKDLEKNQEILLQGIALNRADDKTRSLYLLDLDDKESLVEIYSHYKKIPDIKPGDVVNVAGQISKIDAIPRVKIKNSEQVWTDSAKFELTKPETIGVDDIDEDFVGSFLTVRGMVVKKSGKSIYLASEVEEEYSVRVYSKFSTKELEIKKGSEVTATGILSETDSGFKLTPFTIEDIWASREVLGEKIEAETHEIDISTSTSQVVETARKNQVKNTLIFITAAVILATIAYFIKKRQALRRPKSLEG